MVLCLYQHILFLRQENLFQVLHRGLISQYRRHNELEFHPYQILPIFFKFLEILAQVIIQINAPFLLMKQLLYYS
jgi:hypothetical protein